MASFSRLLLSHLMLDFIKQAAQFLHALEWNTINSCSVLSGGKPGPDCCGLRHELIDLTSIRCRAAIEMFLAARRNRYLSVKNEALG